MQRSTVLRHLHAPWRRRQAVGPGTAIGGKAGFGAMPRLTGPKDRPGVDGVSGS